MNTIKQVKFLEKKISDLTHQYQILMKEREKHLGTLLTHLNLAALDEALLAGGFLFLKDKISTQDKILETWRHDGQKFLKKFRKLHFKESPKDSAKDPAA